MLRVFIFVLMMISQLPAQLFKAAEFDLTGAERGFDGLASNAVSDVVPVNDSLIFFATSNGLSVSQDGGSTIESYYSAEVGIGYGGVSAIAALGEHIWVATVFDSAGVTEVTGTGSGIAHSADGGETWTHYPQMLDHPDSNFIVLFGDSVDALPVTVPIDNITFDMAVHVNSSGDTLLWAASFAGGTRVSRDLGRTWRRVVLPPDGQRFLNEDANLDFDYSPVERPDLGLAGNYNHESFSVLAFGDTIVVGTAAGINFSRDCGRTWENYSAQNSGISGNFVVALGHAPDGTIYAGVLPAAGAGEYRSLVFARPGVRGSLFWENALEYERIYNITSDSEMIYVATQDGAWLSRDDRNWIPMKHPVDPGSGQMLFSDEIYAVAPDPAGRLWAASGDGLAVSTDKGLTWNLIRRSGTFSAEKESWLSAYPNPFSPTRMNVFENSGHVRLHCQFNESGMADLDIYDFAMKKVVSISENTAVHPGIREFVWDGRNALGDICANGVYFVRLLLIEENGSEQVQWTKLIILE